MTDYVYGPYPAYDPNQRQAVPNAEGQVFAPNDTGFTTPLTVTDLTGVQFAQNIIKSTDQSVIEQFRVADYPKVIWKSGVYAIVLTALEGLLQRAEAAETAAEAARDEAAQSADRALDALAPSNQQIDARLGGDSTNLVQTVANKADLQDGKLRVSQLPDAAIQQYLGTVASQAAMLALAGQTGDYCFRTDGTNAGEWRLIASAPTLLASWVKLPGGTTSSGGTLSDTGLVRYVQKVGGVWPTSYDTAGNPVYTNGTSSAGVRPTASASVMVFWCGPDPSPAIVTSGTAGMRDNLDKRLRHP